MLADNIARRIRFAVCLKHRVGSVKYNFVAAQTRQETSEYQSSSYFLGSPPRRLTREESLRLFMSIRYGNQLEELVEKEKIEATEPVLKHIEQGNRSASVVASGNMGLGMHHLRSYKHGISHGVEPLPNECYAALQHAAKKYDIRQGKQFSTYATFWIRQRTKAAYNQETSTISYPVNRDRPSVLSLDQPVFGTETLPTSESSLMADHHIQSSAGHVEDMTILDSVLCSLTPKEREVINAYYDLKLDGDCSKAPSFQKIGEKMGCSGETVRRIHDSGIDRMRKSLQYIIPDGNPEQIQNLFKSFA